MSGIWVVGMHVGLLDILKRGPQMISTRTTFRTLFLAPVLATLAAWPVPSAAAGSPKSFILDPQGVASGQPAAWPAWSHAITNSGIVVGAADIGGGTSIAFTWRSSVGALLDPDFTLSDSDALGVNERGQVVGWGTPGGGGRPILWDEAAAADLMGSLAGSGFAFAINNRGQVVFAGTSGACLWEQGRVTNLGSCSASPSNASDDLHHGLQINDRGDVIGDAIGGSFFWRNGVRTELGFRAEDLNNRGQVVGGSFLWEDGHSTDLGSLGGGGTVAQAINDRGEIVGWSLTRQLETAAFRWWRGRMEPLENPPGFHYARALGINARGQIVGAVDQSQPFDGLSEHHGVLWDGDRIVDLGSSGLFSAGRTVLINDAGQIIHNTFERDCQCLRSFLWDKGTEIEILIPYPTSVSAGTAAGRDGGHDVVTSGATPNHGEQMLAARVVTPEISNTEPRLADLPLRISPNPGGPRGYALSFTIAVAGPVELAIYDVAGHKIDTLISGVVEAGRRDVMWAGRPSGGGQLSRGVYFARLTTASGTKTTKFVHLAQ